MTPPMPAGYHLATDEERKCLPEGSKQWVPGTKGWWESVTTGECVGDNLVYAVPDVKNPGAPEPPAGYHLATDEERRCLPSGSRVWSAFVKEWLLSTYSGGNVSDSPCIYAVPMENAHSPNDGVSPALTPRRYRLASEDDLKCLPVGTLYWEQTQRAWCWSSDYDCPAKGGVTYAVPDFANTRYCAHTGTDPKGAAGKAKDQLQLIPPVLNRETAKAIACGAAKYGPWNWRHDTVESMTYVGAIRRHLDAYLDGEDTDPESGASHLGHIAASCGILLDAKACGHLLDNRPPKGGES